MKAVVGLGNPGSEYDETRHNVGWWVADRLVYDWGFGPYVSDGPSLVSEGRVRTHDVWVVKPTVFMNRSGAALARLCSATDLNVARDLLVVVDDATLDVGRVRLRRSGGAGGHNGLRSVEAGLGTQEYARLRVGVGRAPKGVDLIDWVLSPMPPADEEVVLTRVSEIPEGVEIWMEEGVDAAMNHLNR